MVKRVPALFVALGLLLLAVVPASARNGNAQNSYTVTNLVSDNFVSGTAHDANLRNPWGLTASATSPWWVADNHTDKSTLYDGAGTPRSLVVTVLSRPTGTVFNGSSDFKVHVGTGAAAPARFLFATEDGTIMGWNPAVAPTDAVEGGNRSADGASYKGLAIGSVGSANYLYAADFPNARVDVFDATFGDPHWDGAFVDPNLPDGYAPFGIQNLNGLIFVAYAKLDAAGADEVKGEGLGYVSAFGTDGSFLGRVASRGNLNAPWGLAWAPSNFGKFSGDLLVGNFGDGRINAYAWTSDGWEARGHLKAPNHHAISIDGLWGIGFGNGSGSGAANTLYFAAGPDDEDHGLFGSITGP
jgi:uncharacterized protein (TIGR03118 family)